MVVLNEVQNMFWGLTLDGGKRYSQTVEYSYHISMAALEYDPDMKGAVSVMIQHEKAEFLLCTLQHGKLQQQTLDLNFTEGEEVTFFTKGTGNVHLSGYLVEDDKFDDDNLSGLEETDEDSEMEVSDDDDDSEEDVPTLQALADADNESDDETNWKPKNAKRKKSVEQKKMNKKMKTAEVVEADSDEDDDDDEDFEDVESDDEDVRRTLVLDEAEENDDDDDDDESDNEDLVKLLEAQAQQQSASKKKKNKKKQNTTQEAAAAAAAGAGSPKAKKDVGTPAAKGTPKGNNVETATPSSKKKNKKKNGEVTEQQPQGNKTPKTPAQKAGKEQPKKTPKTPKEQGQGDKAGKGNKTPKEQQGKTPKKAQLAGGVTMVEHKVGTGPEAKFGKHVGVYYTGKLQSGKTFDSCQQGNPFKFKLGKKEVIAGWETGLKGMKVGGKRTITIPPSQGYGQKTMGPIPGNSTLVFDVELKSVS
ncbi:46 kDa FK506-binding nuclear protein-like [Tubulanus polymorphus]|uniref:46 kDa FK506-binding nuclear protein-like n=1 Tax=Tubulanus polymorphus TaxID=672921 RepID=UPI003DA399AF